MKKTKDLNTNRGITLIALVITIIVMLILVAVTISMAVNGGLFDYAGKAVGDTKNAINEEQQLSNGAIKVDGVWYDSIDDYINKKPSTNQGGGETGGEDEETLVSLYKSGELKIGDYVDYNPAGATTVNPDNPENAENVAVGALTGYTTEAQSVAYESLKWRVLGYDETNDKLLLISATPTTGALNFYGHVGYNNYEDVLETTCSKLYSNSSIGATARSITMADIDTYLGGSAVNKTKYIGGSTTEGGYGYNNPSISSKIKIDSSENLVKLGDYEDSVTLDLTSTVYYYMVSDITGTMNQELLQGTNTASPFYYWVASRSVAVTSNVANWCTGAVSTGGIAAGFNYFCHSHGDEYGTSLCLRPIVSLSSNVTKEQVPVIEIAPTVTWNDPLGIYAAQE